MSTSTIEVDVNFCPLRIRVRTVGIDVICWLSVFLPFKRVFASSWNAGGTTPPDDLELEELLDTRRCRADIYVLGFQEIVPLKAGNVLGMDNTNICSKWNALIEIALNKRTKTNGVIDEPGVGEVQRIYPVKTPNSNNSTAPDFQCLISKQMVGIYITVWVRTKLHGYIRHQSVSCVGCGIFGYLGNKGSVSVRFFLGETSFCFVCSHLASGGKEGDERQRNIDAANILSRTSFPTEPLHHLPRKILDHDGVVWLGDLNYRIYLPDATTRSLVEHKEWNTLLQYDQVNNMVGNCLNDVSKHHMELVINSVLTSICNLKIKLKAELAEGHVFEGWHEEEIEFAPTYKYNQNSDAYYVSDNKLKAKERRAPAWCDRIIRFGKGLKQIQYTRGESRLSDHRPVRAIFMVGNEVTGTKKEPGSHMSNRFVDIANHFNKGIND